MTLLKRSLPILLTTLLLPAFLQSAPAPEDITAYNEQTFALLEDLYSKDKQIETAAMNQLIEQMPLAPDVIEVFCARLVKEPYFRLIVVLQHAPEETFDQIIEFYKKTKPRNRKPLLSVIYGYKNARARGKKFLLNDMFSGNNPNKTFIYEIFYYNSHEFSEYRDLLFSKNIEKQIFGLRLAGKHKARSEEIIPVVYEKLGDENPEIALEATRALKEYSGRHLDLREAFFIEKLKSNDYYTRSQAIDYLLYLSYKNLDLFATLAAMAEGDDPYMKAIAENALKKIKVPKRLHEKDRNFIREKINSGSFALAEKSLKWYCAYFSPTEEEFYSTLIDYARKHPKTDAVTKCLYNKIKSDQRKSNTTKSNTTNPGQTKSNQKEISQKKIPEAWAPELIRHVAGNMKFNAGSSLALYSTVDYYSQEVIRHNPELARKEIARALYHRDPDVRRAALAFYYEWNAPHAESKPRLFDVLFDAIFSENRDVALYAAGKRMQLHKKKPVSKAVQRRMVGWYKSKDPAALTYVIEWLVELNYFSQKDIPLLLDLSRVPDVKVAYSVAHILSEMPGVLPLLWERLSGTYSDSGYAKVLMRQKAWPALLDFIASTNYSHEYYIFLIKNTVVSESDLPVLAKRIEDERVGRYAAFALFHLQDKNDLLRERSNAIPKELWLKMYQQNDMLSKSLASFVLAKKYNIFTRDHHTSMLYLAGSIRHLNSLYDIYPDEFSRFNLPEFNRRHFRFLRHRNKNIRFAAVRFLYANAAYIPNYRVYETGNLLNMKITSKEIDALESLLDDPDLDTRGYAICLLFRFQKFHRAWNEEKYFPFLKYSFALLFEDTAGELTRAYNSRPDLQASLLNECLEIPDTQRLQSCLFYLQELRGEGRPAVENLKKLTSHKEPFIKMKAIKTLAIIAASSDLEITDFFAALFENGDFETRKHVAMALPTLGQKARPFLPQLKKLKASLAQKIAQTPPGPELKKLRAFEIELNKIFLRLPFDKEATTSAIRFFFEGENLEKLWFPKPFWDAVKVYPDAVSETW